MTIGNHAAMGCDRRDPKVARITLTREEFLIQQLQLNGPPEQHQEGGCKDHAHNQKAAMESPLEHTLAEAHTTHGPIITTAAGSVPLLLSSGAGTETRIVIGTVIFSGVLAATLFTLFVVPVAYDVLARRTGSPRETRRRLDAEMAPEPDRREDEGEGPRQVRKIVG